MKDKKDCKIVQDLLPNYIENLTSQETNNYIKEHLEQCNECNKIFENMKKKLEPTNEIIDKREINYIKKYSSKLKILRNALIIIIILFVIIVGRKIIILTDLQNKAEKMKNIDNYYAKVETYQNGNANIIESYYKNGKTLMKIEKYPEEYGVKWQMYTSGEETFSLYDNGTTKICRKGGEIFINPVSFTSNFFLVNVYNAIFSSINKVNLNGKECYIVRDQDTEKFIDKDTGIAIKMIDNTNNRTTDYYYEYGNVKDEDVERPDITGYTIKNI